MKVNTTSIIGLYLAETTTVTDHRGELTRLYCERDLVSVLGARRIVQTNYTRTCAVGAVRGMHLQYPPFAEMKFVRCLKGRVWDVAVDLRSGSATFLQWHAEELSPENARMMIVPEGFAHGFQVLEPDSELLYLHTAAYTPAAERGFSCHDGTLAIAWPLPVVDLSSRDASHPMIANDFPGIKP